MFAGWWCIRVLSQVVRQSVSAAGCNVIPGACKNEEEKYKIALRMEQRHMERRQYEWSKL